MARHSAHDEVSTRGFFRRILRRTQNMQGMAAQLRAIAHQAQTSQPVEASLAARIEATAALVNGNEARLAELVKVIRAAHRADDERHDNPRTGERNANAGAWLRDPV